MFKINLKPLKITDLNGTDYTPDTLNKDLGNLIFVHAPSIELSDIARQIHATKSVAVNENQLNEIIHIVRQVPPYAAFATVQIINFLEQLKQEKEVKDGSNQ